MKEKLIKYLREDASQIIAQIFFSALVGVMSLTPLWFFLMVNNLWQNNERVIIFFVLGVGFWIIAAAQTLALILASFLLTLFWFQH